MVETSLIPYDDEEGWMVVTQRKPRKPKQVQALPLCRRKRRSKKKSLDMQRARRSQREKDVGNLACQLTRAGAA